MKNPRKNFYAGPSYLHSPVWQRFLADVAPRDGLSLLEVSHRSDAVRSAFDETEDLVRTLGSVPDTHAVLFLHGGASMQFAMVPMNLLPPDRTAYQVDTGRWSAKAHTEAQRLGRARILATSRPTGYDHIPDIPAVPDDAAYLHITSNNTVHGTQYRDLPTGDHRLVVDQSSDILSRPVNYNDIDLAYAGLQKNLGTAGACLVIIRRDWLEEATPASPVPSMLDYRVHDSARSMFNTPPVMAVLLARAALNHLADTGGVDAAREHNEAKARMLYDAIDSHPDLHCPIPDRDRSVMNPVFDAASPEIEDALHRLLDERGIVGLRGHRSRGGFRASLYNTVPIEHVESLVETLRML